MSNHSQDNKRIAVNTIMLYIRSIFSMAVSLYTSRVILDVLGVEDYGVYNVVGGVVAMFNILFSSMTSAISRFITFEIGLKKKGDLQKVFSSALVVQITIATIIFILAEVVGIWFLNNKLVIPPDRLYAANWVMHCSIIILIIGILYVPYRSILIAYERMKAFAYIDIFGIVLKLIIVFLLCVSSHDKLITFATLNIAVTIISTSLYLIYCHRNFSNFTKFILKIDKELFKKMFTFAGWNSIGTISGILKSQGVNIAINLTCGPAANAARGVALQVNGAVTTFVSNFTTAINPQITKSYASGDNKYLMTLIFSGARYSYYILLLMGIPLIIEAPAILGIWLKEVPEYSIEFVRLALILSLSESLSNGLITAQLATGNIRNYQIIVGGIQLLNFPISYIFLLWGLPPYVTMIVAIFISQICLTARLWFLRGMIKLNAKAYLQKVYLNIIVVTLVSAITPMIIYELMPTSFIRFLLTTIISVIFTSITIIFIGCDKKEREFVFKKLNSFKLKFYGR